MKFFIMRHSESLATLNSSIFAERVPSEIPLTTDGRLQAKMAGAVIKQYYDNNPGRKLKIIHNNAVRVIETAKEVAAALGEVISTFNYDVRSEEFDHGEFNSITSKQMKETSPDIFEKFYYSGNDQAKLLESYMIHMPDGDSKQELLKKTHELLADLIKEKKPNEDVLFVSHGFNCRALEAAICGKDGIWLAREFDTMGRSAVRTIEIDGLELEAEDLFVAPAKDVSIFSKNPTQRVVIVGGGFAGTNAVINLIPKLPAGSEIILFDKTDSFGPGHCFDISLPPCFLFDRVIGDLNLVEWILNNKRLIVEEYSKWSAQFPDSIASLNKTLSSLDVNSIIPRSLYGRYLMYCLDKNIQKGKELGVNVIKVCARVTNLNAKDITWYNGDSSQTINFDYAVLAIGHWQRPKPIEYSNVYNFYNDIMTLAFAPSDMSKFKDKTVFVLGTALSGIDAAIMSLELGAKKVTFLLNDNSTIPHGALDRFAKYYKDSKFKIILGEAEIVYKKSVAKFEIVPKDKASPSINAEILINAAWQDRKADYLPLIQTMKEANTLAINPDGGVKIAANHNLLNGAGYKVENIFVLGTLACGNIPNCENLNMLDQISSEIAEQIRIRALGISGSTLTAFTLANKAHQSEQGTSPKLLESGKFTSFKYG